MRDPGTTKIDGQVIEIMGRNWLINELLRAGLEVATPIRDHGIDLIAFIDLDILDFEGTSEQRYVLPPRFSARPIQLKTVNGERFTVDTKYAKFPDLLLVHVWHLEDPKRTVAYAHSYPQAFAIAEHMGWTSTETWRTRRLYNMSSPSKALIELLEPYRITSPQQWRQLVASPPPAS